MKQRHMPRTSTAAALVVDEAVIVRTSRRDQSASSQPGNAGDAVGLKLGSGLRDVEYLTAKQRLQLVADTERESSDGRDDPEPFVLHVGAQFRG
jgi:hypothetical protein